MRQSSLTTKIQVSEDKGIAVAWAGHEISMAAGKEILEKFRDEEREFPISHLENIVKRTVASEQRRLHYDPRDLRGQIIFVMRSDVSKFHVIRVKGTGERCGQCIHVSDKCVTGDTNNPAISFTEGRYGRNKPIAWLARLAAQLIVTGSRFNPEGVEGLEVLLCRPEGFEPLPEDKINLLTEESIALDQKIRQQLLSWRTH